MTRLYKIKRNVLTRDLERLEYSIRFDIDNPPTVFTLSNALGLKDKECRLGAGCKVY